MIPLGGLSFMAHSLILLAKLAKKIFKLQTADIKARFLRWGLKISPRFCLDFFSKDSSTQSIFAGLIVLLVFGLTLTSAGVTYKIYLKKNSNFVMAADLLKATGVFAKSKSLPLPEAAGLFKEIPFAKEIRQADYDTP